MFGSKKPPEIPIHRRELHFEGLDPGMAVHVKALRAGEIGTEDFDKISEDIGLSSQDYRKQLDQLDGVPVQRRRRFGGAILKRPVS
jgi:hypothetical protein